LKTLIIRKIGMGGAVQSVEDQPHSESAQATLAEAMANKGIAGDKELAAKADELQAKLAAVPVSSGNASNIEIDNIRGNVNAVIERLVATGNIKLGDITADTGDVRISDLSAGIAASKKA
jgi:hypothetical protein